MSARTPIALSALASVLFFAAAAQAGGSGTADVSCGSAPAGWNAPNGALVTNRGPGPVRAVIDSIGEYRTHTMMSHGPGGWVTHETMHSPGQTSWPTYCSTPLRPDELKSGFPGASQIEQGALYTFMYSNGGAEFLGFQRSRDGNGLPDARGEQVAGWLWNSMPYTWTASQKNSSYGFYRLYGSNGALLNYVLYQYRDLGSVNTGGVGWNNGMVCSTLVAYAQNKAGLGTVASYTYDHTKLVNAGGSLYNSVEDECNQGLGFWGGIGAAITCFEGICDDAARQVRNCMVSGVCDSDSSSYWDNVRNNTATVAVSISPDRMGGWSGHGGSGSVWANSTNETVQWNSGGNLYGCWF
ncbi:MAG: hypothetical protein ACXVEE_39930 [Polyangiales bacterium]